MTNKSFSKPLIFLHSVNIEYINSVGAILEDSVLVYVYNDRIPIKFENLKSIILVKKRIFFVNILLFTIFIGIGFVLFFWRQSLLLVVLNLFIISFALFLKVNRYYLYINQIGNSDRIEINRIFKSDAKKILSRVNKKLSKIRRHT